MSEKVTWWRYIFQLQQDSYPTPISRHNWAKYSGEGGMVGAGNRPVLTTFNNVHLPRERKLGFWQPNPEVAPKAQARKQISHHNHIFEDKVRILPDLCHLGAALADDAADELIGDGHLVGLLAVLAPALTRQHRKGWGRDLTATVLIKVSWTTYVYCTITQTHKFPYQIT